MVNNTFKAGEFTCEFPRHSFRTIGTLTSMREAIERAHKEPAA